MSKKTKEELQQSNPDLLLMLMPLLAMMFSPLSSSPPKTVINVYSDKKLEVKDEQ